MTTPGPTPSPSNPASSSIEQQMANVQVGATVGGKPNLAFGGMYGPLAKTNRRFAGGEYESARSGTGQITKSVADMTNEFYGWSDNQKAQFRNSLALINKSFLNATDDQLAQAWGDYVQQSANYLAAGKTMTPMDIFSKDLAIRGGGVPTTKTTKTVDTSLTSRVDSEAIFKSAAQSLLGRNPTDSEYAQFYSNLNAQERANPTVATTTTTTDEEGNPVSSTRTSEGGIGAAGSALLAQRQAEQSKDYGAYQAATTYYNAMLQTIMRGY
jgi:hypothetical protein